ncbi:unnamed protein product [Rotaria magnacalcarata]|uniref:Spermatogenesis-associated protein 1 C-terminal domain-containing protein n=2 Tax=Rotaria magnacalcarata TaxID=392030 RepID=A0A815FM22_9BILA|nr:unnamed protein product [Rotaria magnacalcarata]CAF1633559.1 unnamed protein product [Rotaria magnacalcarata]
MQSQLESERLAVRSNIISIDRPDSSQLVDLHIYIIPKSVWKNLQNLAENETMERAISAGFVHVQQNLNLNDLRQHILKICGQDDAFPKQFIYLRSVGRCLTKVKPQQETELRVKNYRPPMTFAPEIYVLEGHHDDEHVKSANSKSYLFRESPIQQALITPPQLTSSRQQSWVKPRSIPPISSATKLHRSFVRSGERKNSTNFQGHPITSYSNLSAASSTLSARELSKLREEQERLRLRQIELARQRREIEQEQERRQRELLEKQEKLTREQQRQENEAATKIQSAYRKYQNRRKLKEKQKHHNEDNVHHDNQRISNFVNSRGLWSPEPEKRLIRSSSEQRDTHSILLERYRAWRNKLQWPATSSIKNENISSKEPDASQSFGFSSFRQAANDIERLQKEARELARRNAEKEHAEEINAHDVVKLANHLEELKKKRTALETTRETIIRQMQQLHDQIGVHRKEERELWKQRYQLEKKKTAALEERGRTSLNNQSDLNTQLEQAKIRLNNSTKLRQQAEYECQALKQELDNMRSNMNNLQNLQSSKQPIPSQDKQHIIPITLDITLQY